MKIFKKILVVVFCTLSILALIYTGVNIYKKNFGTNRIALSARANSVMGINSLKNKKMAAINTEDVIEEAAAYGGISYDMDAGTSGLGDRKLIKTVDLNTETKIFDDTISWLESYVEEFDGVVDNSYIDSGNINLKNYSRNANYNIRIPAEKLDEFLNRIGDNLNIVYKMENVSDITDEYSDTESKLKSLKISEERLNEMLKKANTVEEMIKVEDKLSSVRVEIENITRRLTKYDKQVKYSSVHIHISEVKDLSEPQIEEDDFSKETLLKLLNDNFKSVKRFVTRIGVKIFTNIPWIVFGLIVICVVLLFYTIIKVIIIKKKSGSKNTVDTNRMKNALKQD